MSIAFVDGKFISVAKNDCPKCLGSGLHMSSPTYHSGQIVMTVTMCECITIRLVERAASSEGTK